MKNNIVRCFLNNSVCVNIFVDLLGQDDLMELCSSAKVLAVALQDYLNLVIYISNVNLNFERVCCKLIQSTNNVRYILIFYS